MSAIEWEQNVKGLGTTLLFVVLWVAAWGVTENIIDVCIRSEKRRILAYLFLLLITGFILLLSGQSLQAPAH